MTVVVGMQAKDGVVMAADSMVSDGGDAYRVSWPKIVLVKGHTAADAVMVGYCGNFRVGQLLEHAMQPVPRPESMSAAKWLVTEWATAARKTLRDHGALEKDKEVEQAHHAAFLLGHDGTLYIVNGDFGLVPTLEGYAATGAGQYVALGALYAIGRSRELGTIPKEPITPEATVRTAVRAACQHVPVCQEPVTCFTLHDGAMHGG